MGEILNFREAMLKRYPAQEYACFFEVRDATGTRGSRSADALVMGLWPSRGLLVEGFELKSHRSDWLRELKNPAKAEKHFRHCDRWWLVTTDKEVARLEEIPAAWGWLAWNGKKLLQLKEAPRNDAVEPMTRPFIAAVLRAAQEGQESAARAKAHLLLADTREAMKNDLEHQLGGELRLARLELDNLKGCVARFNEASGINLAAAHPWDGPHIGRAYRVARAINLHNYVEEAEGLRKRLHGQAQQLEDAIRLYREGEARHG